MERMDYGMPFLLQYENVAWFDNGKVRILDRRVYPTEVRFVECTDYHEVRQAIADMVTQSAGPYTAVGMGMALAAWQVRGEKTDRQVSFLRQAADDLAHARPTTANRYGQITFRALDLAVACSILSSNVDLPVPPRYCFAAEVGLSGEVRPVSRIENRVSEAARLGFERIFVSKYDLRNIEQGRHNIQIVAVSVIEDAFRNLFNN